MNHFRVGRLVGRRRQNVDDRGQPALGYPKQPSNFLKIQALTFRIEKQFGRIGIRQNSLLIEFINSVLKGNTSHYLHSIFHAGFAYVCR